MPDQHTHAQKWPFATYNRFMDIKQLLYFVRVAELGSFTRAAQALDVAQPALSRQIRQLEVELRHSLLERNGRGAIPTVAGQLLLEHGRGILHQMERAREELDRLNGHLSGRVTIGLPPTVARVLAVPLTRAFRQQLPQVRPSISEGLSGSMYTALLDGRLDLAVLYNALPSADIELHWLTDEELVLIEASGSAENGAQASEQVLPLTEVAGRALVIPSRPNALRSQIELEMARLGLRPQVALEIDGVSAILDLVAEGMGCAVLPRNAVTTSTRPWLYRVSRIVSPALIPRLWLACSQRRPITATQQAAMELIRQISHEHGLHPLNNASAP